MVADICKVLLPVNSRRTRAAAPLKVL